MLKSNKNIHSSQYKPNNRYRLLIQCILFGPPGPVQNQTCLQGEECDEVHVMIILGSNSQNKIKTSYIAIKDRYLNFSLKKLQEVLIPA